VKTSRSIAFHAAAPGSIAMTPPRISTSGRGQLGQASTLQRLF
jgi:hypothetical protein